MGNSEHWDRMYSTKPESELSWHAEELTVSIDLIEAYGPAGGSVVDVGGGSSNLAARLVERGYGPCVVVDLSAEALRRAKERVGSERVGSEIAKRIRWQVADVLAEPRLGVFDVWHDRAVFHFLTTGEERLRYVRLAAVTVREGGHLIVATFGLEGPERCSGLPVCRYDAAGVAAVFAPAFQLKGTLEHVHVTPWGVEQAFVYTVLERVSSGGVLG